MPRNHGWTQGLLSLALLLGACGGEPEPPAATVNGAIAGPGLGPAILGRAAAHQAGPPPALMREKASKQLGRMAYEDAPPTESARRGRTLYSARDAEGRGCARCHDGKGQSASTLRSIVPEIRRTAPPLWDLRRHAIFGWAGQYRDLREATAHAQLAPAAHASSEAPPANFDASQAMPPEDLESLLDYIHTRQSSSKESPFDRFLGGDDSALAAPQLRGLELYLELGCTQCHSGSALGGTMLQKLGASRPLPSPGSDLGRQELTQDARDARVFKVPSLRGTSTRGRWLHDGENADLDSVLALMVHAQTTRDPLEPGELADLRAFLESLSEAN